MPLWFARWICFNININKWWNPTKITILYWFAIVFMRKYSDSSLCSSLIVLVCFQHLLFQFTIYDFDSFWFMGYSPVKYLSSTLFLNEHTRKKGTDLMLSSFRQERSTTISNCLFHSLDVAITFTPMSSCITPSHLTHALSHSAYRFLL